jgi:mannosidase alpha-like ER degradation enhancer 2
MQVFMTLIRKYGFPPEAYNLNTQALVTNLEAYFLRPEAVESYMYLYQASRDPFWLQAGRELLDAIEYSCKVRSN